MPRKSLTLNGFLGGLNKDADLKDIKSEGDDKDEVTEVKSWNVNQPGRVRSKVPKISGSLSDLTSAGSESSTDDFLIHGTTFYRKQGVYKIGEDVEWSQNTKVTRPELSDLGAGLSTSASNIQDDGVGLDAFSSDAGSDQNYLFRGKLASLNDSGAAQLASTGPNDGASLPGSGSAQAQYFVRMALETGSSNSVIGTRRFNNHDHMGSINYGPNVGFWDEDSKSYTDDDNYAHTAAENGSAGLIANQGESTSPNPVTIANTDYIRLGKTSIDSDYDARDWGVIFRTGNSGLKLSEEPAGLRIYPDGLYGDGLNINNKDIVLEVQFNKDEENGNNGVHKVWNAFTKITLVMDSSNADSRGRYKQSSGGEAIDPHFKVWEIPKADLIDLGAAESSGSASAADGGTRFKVSWNSAVFTGDSFSPTDVKTVAFILAGGTMTPPDHGSNSTSIWFCRLFEFSFETTNTIGWANTKSKFSQTKVYESSAKNKVESLPQEYGGFLTIGGANTMNINVYEPNANDYQGKIYYQEADGNGNGLGSSFLLAEVSKSKGVKSTLSTFWTSWDSSSFTDDTMCTQDGTKVIQHNGDVSVKVGMRVTKVGGSGSNTDVPADTYVTQINSTAASTKGSEFLVNNNITGSYDNITLKFSGRVKISIPEPPISSTYQLESGFSPNTESINAIWDHSAVVGRQIYIGSVIKTGDYLVMTRASGSASSDNYPLLDTTGYTGAATKTLTITISDASDNHYTSNIGGDTSGDTDAAAGWTTLSHGDGIKIYWPGGIDLDTQFADNDSFTFVITKETDLILKGAIGKRYGFSNLDYIDMELPGTGIKAMYSAGDRLFVFSESQLSVINVAQDYEFMEATMQGHGVSSPKMVVEVDEGLAYVNSTGVYYFDGDKFISLSDDKMMTFNWSTATNISYVPSEKLILVYIGNSDSYAYSLNTKAWVCRSVSVGTAPDTRVKFYTNEPRHLTSGNNLHSITMQNYTGNTSELDTGQISCGNISMLKKFDKVYVTTTNGAELQIKWSIDGGALSSAVSLTDNGTDEIDIDEKGKTIQFTIDSNDTIASGTEISDISLVYRNLRVK